MGSIEERLLQLLLFWSKGFVTFSLMSSQAQL